MAKTTKTPEPPKAPKKIATSSDSRMQENIEDLKLVIANLEEIRDFRAHRAIKLINKAISSLR